MSLLPKKREKALKEEIVKTLLRLIYANIFIHQEYRQSESYDDIIKLENGLRIQYSYFKHDLEKLKTADFTVRLFYDEIYPVLFFKSSVDERAELNLYKRHYPRDIRLDDLVNLQKTINQFSIKETVFYKTAYYPASWMISALNQTLEDELNAYGNESYQWVENKQQEIDMPENRHLKIEDKESLRRELKALLDTFSNNLIEVIMQSYEKDPLDEKTESLRRDFLIKTTQLFPLVEKSFEEKTKQKKLK